MNIRFWLTPDNKSDHRFPLKWEILIVPLPLNPHPTLGVHPRFGLHGDVGGHLPLHRGLTGLSPHSPLHFQLHVLTKIFTGPYGRFSLGIATWFEFELVYAQKLTHFSHEIDLSAARKHIGGLGQLQDLNGRYIGNTPTEKKTCKDLIRRQDGLRREFHLRGRHGSRELQACRQSLSGSLCQWSMWKSSLWTGLKCVDSGCLEGDKYAGSFLESEVKQSALCNQGLECDVFHHNACFVI